MIKNISHFFEVLGNRIESQYGLEKIPDALGSLGYFGDNLPENEKELLKYALKNKLISQKDIEEANEAYRCNRGKSFIF